MINCLIVDDEPFARKIITEFCAHIPTLRVVAGCGNALEARNIMLEQHVDILFLDIHMPVLDGMAFLKTLKNKPQVIFTTAYKEYAADAFDLYAADYLVKPFSFERFIIAVDKALKGLGAGNPTPDQHKPVAASADYFFVRTDGKIIKLLYDEVLFAEAKGNYTKIVTINNALLPKIPFSTIGTMLPGQLFTRVHRSFIINRSKISHIEGNRVYIRKNEIPIGSNYKDFLFKNLGL